MMIDDNTLNQMVAMGIDEKLARRALAESNNNITLALECCFAANSRGGGAPDEQDAIARTGHPAFRKVRQRMYVEKQGIVFADMAIAVRLCYDVLTGVDITIEDGEDQVSTEEAFAFAKDCLPSAVDIICDNCWVGKFKDEWKLKNYNDNRETLLSAARIIDQSIKCGKGELLPTLGKLLDQNASWYTGVNGEGGAPEHLTAVWNELEPRGTLSHVIQRLQDHFVSSADSVPPDWGATSSPDSDAIAPFGDLMRTLECCFAVSDVLNEHQLRVVALCYQRAITEVLQLPPKEVLNVLWQLLNLIALNNEVLNDDHHQQVFDSVCSWLKSCTPETAKQIDAKTLLQIWLTLKREVSMGKRHQGLYGAMQHVALQCWRSGSLERQLFTLECIMQMSKDVNATRWVAGPREGEKYNIVRGGKSSWFTLMKIHRFPDAEPLYDILWDGDSQETTREEMSFKENVGDWVPDPCALSKEEFHSWLVDNTIFDDLFGTLFHAQLLASKGTDFVVYMSREKLLSEHHAKLMVLKAATVHESEKDYVHSLLLKVLKDLVPDSQVSLLRAILQLKPTDAMKIIVSHSQEWWVNAELEPLVCGVLAEVLYQLMDAFMALVAARDVAYIDLAWRRETTAEQGKDSKSSLCQCLMLFTKMIPRPASLQQRRNSKSLDEAPIKAVEDGLGRAASSSQEEAEVEELCDEGDPGGMKLGLDLGLSGDRSPKGEGVELECSTQGTEPLHIHYLRRILARTNQAIAECDGLKLTYAIHATAFIIADAADSDSAAMESSLVQAVPEGFLETLLEGIEAVLQNHASTGGMHVSDYANLEHQLNTMLLLHGRGALPGLGAGQLGVVCRLMSLSREARQFILSYCINAISKNHASEEFPELVLQHLCQLQRFEDYTLMTGIAFVHLFITVNSDNLVLDPKATERSIWLTASAITQAKSLSLSELGSVWDASLTASNEVAKSMCHVLARCFCVHDACETSHKQFIDCLKQSLQECIDAVRTVWDGDAVARQVRRLNLLLEVTQDALRTPPHRNTSAGDDLSIEVIQEPTAYAASLPGDRQLTRTDSAIQGVREDITVNTACSLGALRRVMADKMNVACVEDIQLTLRSPTTVGMQLLPSMDTRTVSELGFVQGCQLMAKHYPADQTVPISASSCPFGGSFAHMVMSDPSWCIYDALVQLVAMAHTAGDETIFCSLWDTLVSFPTRADLKAHLKEPTKVDWSEMLLGTREGSQPLDRAKASVLSLYRLQVLCSLLNPADAVENEKLMEAQEYHQHFMTKSPDGMRCIVRLFLSLPLADVQNSSLTTLEGQPPLVMKIVQTCLHCLRLCVATRHLRSVGSVKLLGLPNDVDEETGTVSQAHTMRALLQAFKLQASACCSSGSALARGAIDAMQVLKAMALASQEIALSLVRNSESLLSGLIESPQDKVKECVYDVLMALLSQKPSQNDPIVTEVMNLLRLSIDALADELLNTTVHPQKYNYALLLAHRLIETFQGSIQGAGSNALALTAVSLLRCIQRHPSGVLDENLITPWLLLLDNLLVSSPWIMRPNIYGCHVDPSETAQFLFHESLYAFPTAEHPTRRPKCLTASARSAATELILNLAKESPSVCEQIWRDLGAIHRELRPLERWSEEPAENAVRQVGQAYVGLKNQGSTCYQNSVLQQIFMLPHVTSRILAACRDTPSATQGSAHDETSNKVGDDITPSRTLLAELGVTLGYLSESVATWYDPLSFVEASERALTLAHPVRRQNDASEFLHALVDSIDKAVEGTPYKGLLQDCLGGSRTTRVSAELDGRVLTRPATKDVFTVLELDVKGMSGVHEALADSIKDENLSGVLWDGFETPLDSVKRARVTSPPRHLALYLKRYVFDLQSLNYSRVNDRFEFPDSLDMAPYMNVAEEGASSAVNTRYRLGGVLIQSGSVSAGHYYSFIRDRFSDKWYKFDDKSVTPCENDVSLWLESECFGGTRLMQERFDLGNGNSSMRMAARQIEKSAYMLIYDREDVIANLQPSVPITSPHRADQTNEPSPKRQKGDGIAMNGNILASNVGLMRHQFAHDPAHLTLLPKLAQIASDVKGIPQQVHEVAGKFWLRHVIRLATPTVEGRVGVPGDAKMWAASLLGVYQNREAREAVFSLPVEDWRSALLECPVQGTREAVADFICNVCGLVPSPAGPEDSACLQHLWTVLVQVLDAAPGHWARTYEFMDLLARLLAPTATLRDRMRNEARSAGLVWRLVRLLLGAEQWQPNAANVLGQQSKNHIVSEELLGMGRYCDERGVEKTHEVFSACLGPVRCLQGPCAKAVWLPQLLQLMMDEAPLSHALEYSKALAAASGVVSAEPNGGFEVRLARFLGDHTRCERGCALLCVALQVEPAPNHASRVSEVAEAIVQYAVDANDEGTDAGHTMRWSFLRGLAQLARDVPRIREWLDHNSETWVNVINENELDPPHDAESFMEFMLARDYDSPRSSDDWADVEELRASHLNQVVQSIENVFGPGNPEHTRWANEALDNISPSVNEQQVTEAALNWVVQNHQRLSAEVTPDDAFIKRRRLYQPSVVDVLQVSPLPAIGTTVVLPQECVTPENGRQLRRTDEQFAMSSAPIEGMETQIDVGEDETDEQPGEFTYPAAA